MTTTSTIPPDYQNFNPLIYTFRDYHTGIQPYFIIVVQFFVFELSLRFWDRAVYGTWLLPSDMVIVKWLPPPPPPPPPPPSPPLGGPVEVLNVPMQSRRRSSRIRTIYLLQPDRGILVQVDQKEQKLPTFDLFDVLFCALPLLAHTIWFCYIQGSCMSGEFATTWNCYNLFGYRIYNYLFSSFTSFAYEYISKLIIQRDKRELGIPLVRRRKKWRQTLATIFFYLALALSSLTFLFVGALILPYLFTNLLPMIVIYVFIVTIYVYIVSVVVGLLKLYTFATGKVFSFEGEALGFFKRQLKKYHFKRRLVIHFGARLFPYLMSILFNLSQSFYYGEDFLRALTREANSRDPSVYFDRVTNSSLIVHTILSTI